MGQSAEQGARKLGGPMLTITSDHVRSILANMFSSHWGDPYPSLDLETHQNWRPVPTWSGNDGLSWFIIVANHVSYIFPVK